MWRSIVISGIDPADSTQFATVLKEKTKNDNMNITCITRDTFSVFLEDGNCQVFTMSESVRNSLLELDGVLFHTLSTIKVEDHSAERFSYSLEEMRGLRNRKECHKPVDEIIRFGRLKRSPTIPQKRPKVHNKVKIQGRLHDKYLVGGRERGQNRKTQKLEEGIRKLLNELSPRKYDVIKERLFSLLVETHEVVEIELLTRCIYEYATRELNDVYDLLAKLCEDLTGFFHTPLTLETQKEGIDRSKRFRLRLLGHVQRGFYSYLPFKSKEEREKEGKSEERNNSEISKKNKKGARENLLFVTSLYDVGLVGNTIFVEIIKKLIFSIYPWDRISSSSSTDTKPKPKAKNKSKVRLHSLYYLEDLCVFWERVCTKLRRETIREIRKFQTASRREEERHHRSEKLAKADSVRRKYESLVGFILSLTDEEIYLGLSNFHREKCRRLLKKLPLDSEEDDDDEDRKRRRMIDSQWEKDLEASNNTSKSKTSRISTSSDEFQGFKGFGTKKQLFQ